MAQLHLYLPDALAMEVRRRAEVSGKSVSAYLAELVRTHVADEWPKGFFENVVGGWAGDPLTRGTDLPLENRDPLDVPTRHERVHKASKR